MGRPNRCTQGDVVLVGLGDVFGDVLGAGLTPGLGVRVALAVTCGATP
jgi:hypothetical protein